MIKILLVTAVMSFNASAISYSLVIERYKENNRYQEFVDPTITRPEYIQGNKKIPNAVKTGYILKGNEIYHFLNENLTNKWGNIVKCEGLNNQCLIIYSLLKIKLPSDFDFTMEQSWEWEGYEYTTVARKKHYIYGEYFDSVEVLGFCKSCEVKIVRFEYEKTRGIINFNLESNKIFMHYILDNKKGIFAP